MIGSEKQIQWAKKIKEELVETFKSVDSLSAKFIANGYFEFDDNDPYADSDLKEFSGRTKKIVQSVIEKSKNLIQTENAGELIDMRTIGGVFEYAQRGLKNEMGWTTSAECDEVDRAKNILTQIAGELMWK